jgi:ElaB/YqjD/DUF883 family membrane-anchored ribosome-binding protein
MSTPQEIQEQIERTRATLSSNVDRLGEKVSPGKAVGRRVDKVKSGVRSVREKVMGVSESAAQNVSSTMQSAGSSAGSVAESTRDALGSAVSSVGDVASSTRDALADAPQQARRQAQGNPLAAGLIAFGVGWLLSSLVPATEAELRLGEQAEQQAKELVEPAKEQAQQVAQQLQEPMQQAVEQVRSTATDAVHETVDQARSASEEVKAPLTQ